MKWKRKLSILRPTQWVKNVLIGVPLIFSQNFFNVEKVLLVTAGFLVFCGLASAAYILNDLSDKEKDQKHPLKNTRPLASGALSEKEAIVGLLVLALVSLGGAWSLHAQFATLGLAYLGLNVAYTFWLKRIVIVDVMVLALFYVIRVWAGALIIDVPVTPWLLIATMLLALFLGFGKRRHELTELGEKAESHRLSLKEYSPYFLDQLIGIVTTSTILLYIIYTLDERTQEHLGTQWLPVTIPFVVYGIFRYLFLIHERQQGGSPTQTIFTDKPLLVDGMLWGALLIFLLR